MKKKEDKYAVEAAIAMYYCSVDSANEVDRRDVVFKARRIIKRKNYKDDISYYTDLTEYIYRNIE